MESDIGFEGFEERRPQESLLIWIIRSLGMRYAMGLPFVALVAFAIVRLILLRGRGPFAVSGMILAVAMPILLGLYGALEGMMASFQVISNSTASPRPNEIAEGVSMSLVAPLIGMFLATPAFLVAMVGSMIKSMAPEPPQQTK